MKKKRNKIKSRERSLLCKLTVRTTLFFLLMTFVLILLYVCGNFQHFLDSTQGFILYLLSGVTVPLFTFAIAGILESIVMMIRRKSGRFWAYLMVFLVSAAIAPAIFVICRILLSVSHGIQ